MRKEGPDQGGGRGGSRGCCSLGELIWVSLGKDQLCHSQSIQRSLMRIV